MTAPSVDIQFLLPSRLVAEGSPLDGTSSVARCVQRGPIQSSNDAAGGRSRSAGGQDAVAPGASPLLVWSG